jgi:hypothetical protein
VRRANTLQLLAAGFLLASPCLARAQNYAISWYAITGGGGSSTDGVYSLTGTIGQSSAGRLSGGNYTLEGGFWGLIATVQTPGAPRLSIQAANSKFILSWTNSGPAFTLQQNPNLNVAGGWSNVSQALVLTNGLNTVTVPNAGGNQFFRLGQ